MSQLGKILIYVALAGAVAAVIAGGLIVKKRGEDAQQLASTQAAKTAAEAATKKAQSENAELTQAKTKVESDLADANKSVADLTDKLTAATKQASDASAALQTAKDDAKKAQDALDALNKSLNGQTVDDLVAAKTKAESDLKDKVGEEQILQGNVDDLKKQVADLQDAINRSQHNGQMPGVSGKVTFVDHAWNFVILNVGVAAGVVPNGELIVYRGRTFLGKVRVTKVDPNDSVAEILPDVKGDIQIGDAVLN